MDIGELVVSINGDPSGLNNALNQSTTNVDKAIGQIAGAVGLGTLAWKGMDLAIQGIKFNAMMESARTSFSIMLGSVDDAKAKLGELKYLADHSPLTFSGVTAATTTLLQFGVAGDKVIPTVKMLGDVAGGNEQRMQQLALAFAQVSAAGKIQGQDLLQMINAGYNPLMTISAKTGESMMELRKRMEAGGISALEVADAFKIATSEGGQFFGMLNAQAKTLTGSFTTMGDAVETFLGRSTETFTGPLLGGVQFLTGLLNGIPGEFGAIALAVVTVTAGVGALALTVGALAPAFAALGVTINFALLPLLGVTAAVAAIGTAVFLVAGEVDKANKGALSDFRKTWDEILKTSVREGETLDDVAQRAMQVRETFRTLSLDGNNFNQALDKTAVQLGLTKGQVAAIVAKTEDLYKSNQKLSQEYLDQYGLLGHQGTLTEALKEKDLLRLDANQRLAKQSADAYAIDKAKKQTQAEMIADLKVWDALNTAGIKTDSDWLNAKIDIREKIIDSITTEALKKGELSEQDKKDIKVQQDAIAGYQVALDKVLLKQKEVKIEVVDTSKSYWELQEAQKTSAATTQKIGDETSKIPPYLAEATGKQYELVEGQIVSIEKATVFVDQQEVMKLRYDEIAKAVQPINTYLSYSVSLFSSLGNLAQKFGNEDLATVLNGLSKMSGSISTAVTSIGKLFASGGTDIGAWVSLATSSIDLVADAWDTLWGKETKKQKEDREREEDARKKAKEQRMKDLDDLMDKYNDHGKTAMQILKEEEAAEIAKAVKLKASADEIAKIRKFYSDAYLKLIDDESTRVAKAAEEHRKLLESQAKALSDYMNKYEDAGKDRLTLIHEEWQEELKKAEAMGATYDQLVLISNYYKNEYSDAVKKASKAVEDAYNADLKKASEFMRKYRDAGKTDMQLLEEERSEQLAKVSLLYGYYGKEWMEISQYYATAIADLTKKQIKETYDLQKEKSDALDAILIQTGQKQVYAFEKIMKDRSDAESKAWSLGATREQVDLVTKYYNDLISEVRLDPFRKIGDSMASELNKALSSGLSKQDFTANIMDVLKGMVTEAAILAGGFADRFAEIGLLISNAMKTGLSSGVLGEIKGRLSEIFTEANATVGVIDSLFAGSTDTIPGFAGGTLSAPGGISLVGERGPELVNLPRGASVLPAQQTQQVLSGSGKTFNISVQSNSPLDPLQTGAIIRETMESLAFQGVA